MIIKDERSLAAETEIHERVATKVFKIEAGRGYTERELAITWGFGEKQVGLVVFEMWAYDDARGERRTGVSRRLSDFYDFQQWKHVRAQYQKWTTFFSTIRGKQK